MAHSHDRMLRLALCLLALLLAVPAAATNLLSNGSFESGVACGDAMLLGPGSTGIDGWVVTGAGIDYCGTRWTAAYGTRSVGLNGTAAGGIAQTIPTQVGGHYAVHFWISGDPDTQPYIKWLRLTAGQASADFSADVTAMWAWDPGWNPCVMSFLADSIATTIQFTSLMSGDYGPAIDSVTVELTAPAGVPLAKPAALALSVPAPNPSPRESRMEFWLPAAATVRLGIFDLAGREIAVLAQGELSAGRHEAAWDGRITGGGQAPAGLYLVALRVPGRQVVQRLMRLR